MKKEFRPQLTPQEMLELGVFGGWYFKGDIEEYPEEWFENARLSENGFDVSLNYFEIESGLKLSTDGFDEKLNYFEVRSGQTMSVWKEKGGITPEDPLGWFQWYCRYSLGRRIPGVDEFQIKRWKAFGPRHIGGITSNCEKGDIYCRPRQRQALLQWSYDPFI